MDCCCWRILYNQPDFANVKPVLQTFCHEAGFLLKFHCELNFIEQCWGYAKRVHQHYPWTSKKEDLHRNVINALDCVPLVAMHKCVLDHCYIVILTQQLGFQHNHTASWMLIERVWQASCLGCQEIQRTLHASWEYPTRVLQESWELMRHL